MFLTVKNQKIAANMSVNALFFKSGCKATLLVINNPIFYKILILYTEKRVENKSVLFIIYGSKFAKTELDWILTQPLIRNFTILIS